jgi:hypothetical protein
MYDFHVYDSFFENSFKEGIEKEQKEFRALLVSKGFFESEVQSERSKLRVFKAGFVSHCFRHNPPSVNI